MNEGGNNRYIDAQDFERLRKKFHSLSDEEKIKWRESASKHLEIQPNYPKALIDSAYKRLVDEAKSRTGKFANLSKEELEGKLAGVINGYAILTNPLFFSEGDTNKIIDETHRQVTLAYYRHILSISVVNMTTIKMILTKMMHDVRWRKLSLEDVETFTQEYFKPVLMSAEATNEVLQRFDLKTRF